MIVNLKLFNNGAVGETRTPLVKLSKDIFHNYQFPVIKAAKTLNVEITITT